MLKQTNASLGLCKYDSSRVVYDAVEMGLTSAGRPACSPFRPGFPHPTGYVREHVLQWNDAGPV